MSHVASRDFFDVTAQVIPVLLLALAVEGRIDLPGWDEPFPRPHARPRSRHALRRLAYIGLVGLGEAMALMAIAGRPTAAETAVVTEVLGMLVLMLISPLVFHELEWVRSSEQPWYVQAVAGTLAVVIVVGATGPGIVLTTLNML